MKQHIQLANEEATPPVSLALRLGQPRLPYLMFKDETGPQNHLNGCIAKALMPQAPNLLSVAPMIERLDVLDAKLPR